MNESANAKPLQSSMTAGALPESAPKKRPWNAPRILDLDSRSTDIVPTGPLNDGTTTDALFS